MKARTHLHRIRQQRGLTAIALAKLASVTRQAIYAIEAGNYVPNTTVALQLAKALDVRVEELFSLETASAGAPKPVTVDLLTPARRGQPVQLCRVGNRIIGVSASPHGLLFSAADAIV